MPELRWILSIFGLALLIGIYLWGRRSSSAGATERPMRDRSEPALDAASAFDDAHEYANEARELEAFPEEDSSAPSELAPPDDDDLPEHAVEDSTSGVEPQPVRERHHARIEPTLSDESMTAEQPAKAPESSEALRSEAPPRQAPTPSMSSTPAPRRIERRKIIVLRLAVPQRIPGDRLLEALQAEALQHGKYEVFHRMDEHGSAIFSVASMVEPGTFELDKMAQESYPGITLFAQLPGPIAGMLAFNELVNCGRRLHATLGGTLQDERGVPLTVHRIERIRQEIRDFEQRAGAGLTASP